MSKKPTPKKRQERGRSSRRYAAFSNAAKKRLNQHVEMAVQREKRKDQIVQKNGLSLESTATTGKVTKIQV